jgi:hypothetical protein
MKKVLKIISRVGSFLLLSFLVFASGFLARFSGEKEKTFATKNTPISLFSIPQAHADAPAGDSTDSPAGSDGGGSGGGGSSDSSEGGSGDC